MRTIQGPFVSGDSIDIKGNKLLVGSYTPQNQVQVFDLGTGAQYNPYGIQNAYEAGSELLVSAARFSKTRNEPILAVAGTGSNECRLYEVDSRRLLGTISELEEPLYCIDFANTSCKMALGGADGALRVINITNLDPIPESPVETKQPERRRSYFEN